MLVSEIMSTPVVTATAERPSLTRPPECVSKVWGRWSSSTASATGILTERDLVRLAAGARAPAATPSPSG